MASARRARVIPCGSQPFAPGSVPDAEAALVTADPSSAPRAPNVGRREPPGAPYRHVRLGGGSLTGQFVVVGG
jgi:hypothetical protein